MAGNRIDTVRDIGRAIPDPASTDPKPMGTVAEKGTSEEFARNDHVHQFLYAIVKDIKQSGISGGASTAGVDMTRDINNLQTNIPGVSLTTNQLILPSGSYLVDISCPAYLIFHHQAWLYNVSDSATVLAGSSEYAYGSTGGTNRSYIVGEFTITETKTFEIRHRCSVTRGINGLGVMGKTNLEDVYTQGKFIKIG